MKCGFWQWCEKGEATGASSTASVTKAEEVENETSDDMACMFESQVELNDEKETCTL